jgi:hypothetical protein
MRGIPIENRRVMICIGGPYLPKTSYFSEAESFNFEDLVKELEVLSVEKKTERIAQILKIDDTKSEFVNAIGRVKDPKAQERSIVFTLGIQRKDVSSLLVQNGPEISKPYVTQPCLKGGFRKEALTIAKLWTQEIHTISSQNVKDISIIARIIRIVKNKQLARVSEIIPGKTRKVLIAARRNYAIMQSYGIRLFRKKGGFIFETSESQL